MSAWPARSRKLAALSTALLALLVAAAPAMAELQARVKVAPGQSLALLARRYGCTIGALQRANGLRTVTIHPGQTLAIPVCGGRPAAAATGTAPSAPRRAPIARKPAASQPKVRVGQSRGQPWRGWLYKPTRLAEGDGYLLRRPERTYGCAHVVATIEAAIAQVRATHPELHTLAIGDLSAARGGWLNEHASHQSGRDVDLGFYYRHVPPGYPQAFAKATAENLDYAATWDLLVAFARTADAPLGVQAIFLDYGVQGMLYEWAKARGVDERYLDRLFQYPNGKWSSGLVHHEPYHDDHLHIRFKCPPRDRACR